jgi:glycosyltransferase involved in cell wall biosynthesis
VTRLRVLIITDELEIGGTQRQIASLVKVLPSHGVDAGVLFFRHRSHLADEIEASGCPVVQVERRGRLDIGFPWRLARAIRAFRPDVIHAFALAGEFWTVVARLLQRRPPPLVTSIRGRYEWYSTRDWRAKRWISSHSRRVVSNSAAGADYAVTCGGVRQDQLDIIPNGIDLDAFDASARRGWPSGLPTLPGGRVLFVGRFVDHKNLPCLLRALALLNSRGRPTGAYLVGDGPLREPLNALAGGMGIGHLLCWLGERSDVPALMAGADCVVLPSHREGLSNAILEGMAAARPIVATAVGGSVELVSDGVTGILCPDDDAGRLAEALARVLDDPALARRMGVAGRERIVQDYSAQALGRQMSGIYKETAR